MRPIVPCHSCMQGPAAKVASKMLKPVLAGAPFVITGSKDLARKLSQLHIPKHDRVWIVSADIVAFYPNIPLEKCLDLTLQIFKEWNQKHGVYTLEEVLLFRRCLRAANMDLVTEFNGTTYQQVRGLAMGVACSPDVANLYGAIFESDKVTEMKKSGSLHFFGRYIDDLLAVVTAPTKEAALAFCQQIKYEDVELTWDVSDRHMPFLDLFVYIDPVTNQIEHTPYRKARNHLERIPFASHHPMDVKRGTFLGEMSRLATLSSKFLHYSDACKELIALYYARGYPKRLIDHWLRENIQLRWAKRLDEPRETADTVFALKTTFNPIWSEFDVHALQTTIYDHWADYLRTVDWYEAPDDVDMTIDTVESRAASPEGGPLAGPSGGSVPAEAQNDPADTTDRSTLSALQPHLSSDAVLRFYGRGPYAPKPKNVPVPVVADELGPSNVPEPSPPPAIVSSDDPVRLRWQPLKGRLFGRETVPLLDIRRTDIVDRKLLVSRRRTTNLFDLTAQWKKAVLQEFVDREDPISAYVNTWS